MEANLAGEATDHLHSNVSTGIAKNAETQLSPQPWGRERGLCLTPKRPLAGESRCGMDMRQRKDDMEYGKVWGFSVHHRR